MHFQGPGGEVPSEIRLWALQSRLKYKSVRIRDVSGPFCGLWGPCMPIRNRFAAAATKCLAHCGILRAESFILPLLLPVSSAVSTLSVTHRQLPQHSSQGLCCTSGVSECVHHEARRRKALDVLLSVAQVVVRQEK